MLVKIEQTIAPEEVELKKKTALFDRLGDRLADREEEMADLRAELERFEAQYTMQVGRLYAEQDDIDAQIAEEEVKLVPDDQEIKKRAEELRRRAEESAARANDEKLQEQIDRIKPTAEAKKAYHDLARIIHPDLALDSDEKEKRHGLMAKLNEAYQRGDQAILEKLADDYRLSPDSVKGNSPGDNLVRVIRQISQVRRRLGELKQEKERSESSELFDLYQKDLSEKEAGRDMLKHMAGRARTHIAKSQRRLENLKNVNLSAEEYVKEKYDLNIADFR